MTSIENTEQRITAGQLKTIASYAVLIVLGAYLGHEALGLYGLAAGAVLAIPVSLAIGVLVFSIVGRVAVNRKGKHES